jgi:hypothetical protein
MLQRSHLPPTPEAMGIWWFAGAFTDALRQSECGSKACEMNVSQPITHRRVLAVCFLIILSFLRFLNELLIRIIF